MAATHNSKILSLTLFVCYGFLWTKRAVEANNVTLNQEVDVSAFRSRYQGSCDSLNSRFCQNGGCSNLGSRYYCDCITKYGGRNCEIALDWYPCQNKPCLNGGTCQVEEEGFPEWKFRRYFCWCPAQFFGLHCEWDKFPCRRNPCLNGGTCRVGPSVPWLVYTNKLAEYCDCPAQYNGFRCQRVLDPCTSIPCLNGGSCSSQNSTYSCRCISRYTGRNCEIQNNPCSPNPCQNGGRCYITKNRKHFCICKAQFTGSNCERVDCNVRPCRNRGTCLNVEHRPFCYCPLGTTGKLCEDVLDPCTSSPCLNGGSCSSQNSEYSCRCIPQYTGKNCEIQKVLDPCSPNPCQNGGRCYNIGNKKHYCFCKVQFIGGNCERVNCNNRPCRNRGTCLNVGNRSFCRCPAGITGKLCEGEIPVITKNPQDSTAMEGGSVTFCCEAKGKPVPVYSWFHNGVLVQELISRNLRLSSISSRDSGTYKCSAKNEHGETVSSKAELTVVPGNRQDSCHPTPLTRVVSLPEGCTEDSSGRNSVNVGTCSNEACVKRNQRHAGRCGGHDSNRQCCSAASMSNSRVSCKSGIKFNIQKVSKCACADCAVSKIVVRGKVVDPEGSPLWRGEMTLSTDAGKRYYTDRQGNFKILVRSGTKRIVLTVKDKFQGLLEDTTKVFELQEGQVSFYTIVLQKKPPAIKFPANKKKNIPLGPIVVFFDYGHLRLGNFYPAVPIDVVRVKSYVNSSFDPTSVPVRITINKLNLLPKRLVVFRF
ncbi:neurogenic locus notch homolog protein 1-like [Stylophora pistillata]|uniref:neurogenic locus notch homolog protein 1-like n=1 Tax=Stylophora pistillata TaxID=50429 RepID=UPI000C0397BF|nr:neurogenic locus notch homolog protein 1-like [Stylophora pistillata]